MKQTIIYSIVLLLFCACKAQNNQQQTTQMKTFDIATFNKNKNHLNEYFFITKNGTTIKQNQWQYGYEEVIKPKGTYIFTYNKYYNTGKLKLTGDFYPYDFEKGIWKEYDEQGNLIKETDYDAPYKFTWEDILAFIKKRGIDMDNEYLEIGRNIVNGKPVWSIIWEKEDKSSLRIVGIDGITGKIFQENDRDYPELD